MLKKVVLGTAMSVVIFSGAEAHVKTGFYTGAAVGVSKNSGTGQNRAIDSIPADYSTKFNQNASGFVGQIFAGYEEALSSSFVLGGEFFAAIDTAKSKKDSEVIGPLDIRKNTLKQKHKLGLSVNAGMPVGDSVTIYGKLAAVNGRFSLKHDVDPAGLGYSGGTVTKNVWGIEPGVRVKVAMNQGWAMQFDVNYAMYQTFKTKNFDNANADFIDQVRVTPRIWTALVGLSYKF